MGNKEGRGSVGLLMNSMHIRCQPKEVNQLTKGHLDHLWNWSPGINSLFFFAEGEVCTKLTLSVAPVEQSLSCEGTFITCL